MQATYSAISGFYFGSTGRFQTEALPVPFIHLTLVGRKPICANVNSHHLPKYGWTSDRLKPLEFSHDVQKPLKNDFRILNSHPEKTCNEESTSLPYSFLIFGTQPKNSHIFKLSQILLSKLHHLSASTKPSLPPNITLPCHKFLDPSSTLPSLLTEARWGYTERIAIHSYWVPHWPWTKCPVPCDPVENLPWRQQTLGGCRELKGEVVFLGTQTTEAVFFCWGVMRKTCKWHWVVNQTLLLYNILHVFKW